MANANPANNTIVAGVTMQGGNENESTPAEQRDPIGNCPKTDGPKMGDSGNYERAEYVLSGEGKNKIIRRDR